MKKIYLFTLFIIASIVSSTAMSSPISTASLSGFIQNGTISNDIGSGAAISSIVYDLGAAGDGIATWDSRTGTGVASNFLSNPRYFQTLTWSGLNILSGSDFSFAGLDIDLIQSLTPLSVTGNVLDNVGTSLTNASLSIYWDNGDFGTASLTQQAWETTQNLTINAANIASVPEPGPLALFGLALAGLYFARKKKA